MASLNLPNVFENSKFPPVFSIFWGVSWYCIVSWSLNEAAQGFCRQICIRVTVCKRGRARLLQSDLYLGFSGITRGYLLPLLVLFLSHFRQIPSACGSVTHVYDSTRAGNRLVVHSVIDIQINCIAIKYNK